MRLSDPGAGGILGRRRGVSGTLESLSNRPSVIFSASRVHVTVAGCSAFYSAVLSCCPSHTVTISPGNVPACIRVSPSLHIFTRDNWQEPQFFRVAAVVGAYDEKVWF